MDISKFPTDNLYKFIAIFGLVIFIVSYFYPTILYNKVLYQSAEINADLETLEQKITSQENLIKFLQKLSDKATNKNKDTIIKSLFEEKVKLTKVVSKEKIDLLKAQINILLEIQNKLK